MADNDKGTKAAQTASDPQTAPVLTKEQEAAIAAKVDAQIQKLLANAEKKADSILADAEEKAAAKAQEILDAAEEKAVALMEKAAPQEEDIAPPDDAYLNELVEIELFRDEKDYKDDLFVAINDRAFLIQRGKPVKVPRYVAQHIEASRKQDIKTAKLIADTQEQSRLL